MCICYATLGIPLFLMSLTKVSFILADVFRYLYRRLFCAICINLWESHHQNVDAQLEAMRRSKALEEEANNIVSHDVTAVGGIRPLPVDTGTTTVRAVPIVRDVNDETNDSQNERVKVPLIIVLVCLLTYIVFGAYIFTLLEDLDWEQGIYYCYVSLSTIGNIK